MKALKIALAAFVASAALAGPAGAADAPAASAVAEQQKPAVEYAPVAKSEKAQAAAAFMDNAPQNDAAAFGMNDLEKLKPNQAAPAEFDPKTNPRVYEISTQLRCLVCSNESIAESNVELALDLRREVAKQVKAGKTDEEIIDFMVDRYGDYVLFKPPFKAKTYLLWLGPAVFFLLAVWAMFRIARSRRLAKAANRGSATPADIERAKKILKGELVFKEGEFVPASGSKTA